MRGLLITGGIIVAALVIYLLVHAVWVSMNCTTFIGTQVCR
jgi:hypothetical protein